jgi:hypothetical protein
MNVMENEVIMKDNRAYVTIERTPDNRYLVYYPQDSIGGITYKFSEMPEEDVQQVLDGKRTVGDIGFKAAVGEWPSTEEERLATQKNFFIKFPKLLINNPKSQARFTRAELEELLPPGAEILACKDE